MNQREFGAAVEVTAERVMAVVAGSDGGVDAAVCLVALELCARQIRTLVEQQCFLRPGSDLAEWERELVEHMGRLKPKSRIDSQ